jgi:hypothetical protein
MNKSNISPDFLKIDRFAVFFFFLLCAFVAHFNANIGIIVALVGGLILTKRFGLIEYIGCTIILLVISQSDKVLSSVDLASHVETFESISKGQINMVGFQWGEYMPGEIILPSIFWLFGLLTHSGSVRLFSFLFVLSFLIAFYFMLKGLNLKPVVFLFVVLLVDVTLVVHLYRQSISSVLLLIGLWSLLAGHKIKLKNYFLLTLTYMTHLTSLVFTPLAIIFNKSPLFFLKLMVVIAGFFAFHQDGREVYREFIALAHGVPILGKMSFALQVYDKEGGIRLVALIAIIIGLLTKEDSILLRIFLGFSALMLFVYDVPILSTRVGLIGTSLLTGLPIGIFVLNLKKYLVRILNAKINSRLPCIS